MPPGVIKGEKGLEQSRSETAQEPFCSSTTEAQQRLKHCVTLLDPLRSACYVFKQSVKAAPLPHTQSTLRPQECIVLKP